MVRVSKNVAEKRKMLALSMAKNLEPFRDMDEDPDIREAASIVIKSLEERCAYGGKRNNAITSND